MSIASLDDYIASAKQRVVWVKPIATRVVAPAAPFTLFDIAGNPGAGSLSVSSLASGVVHDDTVAGYPSLNAFGSGATGYISKIEFTNTVSCFITLYDRLWVGGTYSFNASQTLSSQPSFSSRLPGGSYAGLELWIEAVTAFTGNLSLVVNYTNQSGTTGKSTGTIATGVALTVGRAMQCPLATGDYGIQKVESVTGTVATAGTFNVMILRPLWAGRVPVLNSGDVHDLLRTGLPQIYTTSALFPLVSCDSTSSGNPQMTIEIANN